MESVRATMNVDNTRMPLCKALLRVNDGKTQWRKKEGRMIGEGGREKGEGRGRGEK